MPRLRVATRGSRLALTQTRRVCADLSVAWPELSFEEIVVRTTGDRVLDPDLAQMSRTAGIGFFVKEVEAVLREGGADFAVHSLKDMPVVDATGLILAAVPERKDPRDGAALSEELRRTIDPSLESIPPTLDCLPEGATVGTSSPRRKAQLLHRRPDLTIVPLRGNVPTRLEKVASGRTMDAAVLALAGLQRLDLAEAAIPFGIDSLLPAAGQGALGIQAREDDSATYELLKKLEHAPTRHAVDAERAFLGRLQGGCAVPAAVLASCDGPALSIRARVLSPDGSSMLSDGCEGPIELATRLGAELAEQLLGQGAASLLEARS